MSATFIFAGSEKQNANIYWVRAKHNDGYIFTLRGNDKSDGNSYAINQARGAHKDDTEMMIMQVLNG